LRNTKTWLRLRWVSVRVKFADPVSSAEVVVAFPA
jgi:hypothetical protein